LLRLHHWLQRRTVRTMAMPVMLLGAVMFVAAVPVAAVMTVAMTVETSSFVVVSMMRHRLSLQIDISRCIVSHLGSEVDLGYVGTRMPSSISPSSCSDRGPIQ
jgi:hypothetical protein